MGFPPQKTNYEKSVSMFLWYNAIIMTASTVQRTRVCILQLTDIIYLQLQFNENKLPGRSGFIHPHIITKNIFTINDNVFSCVSRIFWVNHYNEVIMSAMASQITSLTIVYSIVYSGADQRKHQSSASLAFVRGIHWWPVNSPHKEPITRKMFPFGDVIVHCRFMVLTRPFML